MHHGNQIFSEGIADTDGNAADVEKGSERKRDRDGANVLRCAGERGEYSRGEERR
jgi:hypothetical protein